MAQQIKFIVKNTVTMHKVSREAICRRPLNPRHQTFLPIDEMLENTC